MFSERRVSLWDLRAGARMTCDRPGWFDQKSADDLLDPTGDFVASLAFSPDGSFLAAGTHDHMVAVWEVESGSNVASFQNGRSLWIECAINPCDLFEAKRNLESVFYTADGKLMTIGKSKSGIVLQHLIAIPVWLIGVMLGFVLLGAFRRTGLRNWWVRPSRLQRKDVPINVNSRRE